MQEQPELVGRGLGAGGAVGRQMRLPGLDVVFRLAAPSVDILVKYTGVATEPGISESTERLSDGCDLCELCQSVPRNAHRISAK